MNVKITLEGLVEVYNSPELRHKRHTDPNMHDAQLINLLSSYSPFESNGMVAHFSDDPIGFVVHKKGVTNEFSTLVKVDPAMPMVVFLTEVLLAMR